VLVSISPDLKALNKCRIYNVNESVLLKFLVNTLQNRHFIIHVVDVCDISIQPSNAEDSIPEKESNNVWHIPWFDSAFCLLMEGLIPAENFNRRDSIHRCVVFQVMALTNHKSLISGVLFLEVGICFLIDGLQSH
jgi:hypothetical protein